MFYNQIYATCSASLHLLLPKLKVACKSKLHIGKIWACVTTYSNWKHICSQDIVNSLSEMHTAKKCSRVLQNLFYFVNPLFKMSSHLTPVPLVTLLSTKNNQLASYTWHKFPQDKFSKKVARKMRSKNLRKKITLYQLQILKLFLLLVFIVSTFVNH